MTYTKLKEFSVVYTDRSLNHMSDEFIDVMKDIDQILKRVYNADATAIIPGSGTFGMEAVVRQFAHTSIKEQFEKNKWGKVLIIRNGWFSYRWSEIFDMAGIEDGVNVITGQPLADGYQAQYQPPAIKDIVKFINEEKPDLVFAPHVETSCGMILPDEYLTQIGTACRDIGALFVLDCIASGAAWVDMKATNVDILISAPQKGWSSTPCCALISMSERARLALDETRSNSYSMDILKWTQVMEKYVLSNSWIYHTTLPTDALKALRDTMLETQAVGFDFLKNKQFELGNKARELLVSRGFPSVAAKGFYAPGVVVCYTTDSDIQTTLKFRKIGYQTAAGVPLQIGERKDFQTFRIGLFGLDKLTNVDKTIESLTQALDHI